MMIRKQELNPPGADATSAEQTCLPVDRVVKEDLKKIFFTTLKNINGYKSLDEQQIYGFDRYMWEQNRYFARPNG